MSDASSDTRLEYCTTYADGNVPAGARAAAFFGSFIPTLLAVFFLSTPRLRKQWAFWILVAALLIAMGKCILEMHVVMRSDTYRIDPTQPESWTIWNQFYNADYFVQWVVPWICDCALLCKLLSFHPASTTPWQKRAAIMAFPLFTHVPRIPLLIASLVVVRNPYEGWALTQFSCLATEGALQAAQNCYCSGFLLIKARQYACADYAASTQQAHRVRLGLRYFTESILFTFLPASLLQVGWLVLALLFLRTTDNTNLLLTRADFYLRIFNVMFSINFGLLAVWWATARIHAQSAGASDSQLRTGTAKQAASALDMSLLDWALGPIAPEDSQITIKASTQPERSLTEVEQGSLAEDEKEEEASLRRRRQSKY